MNTSKRIVSILLVLTLTVLMLPTQVHGTQSMYHNFSSDYTLTGDGAGDIVAVALAQYGMTGEQLGYTEEWCADFVGDCAYLAGQSEAIEPYGGVAGMYDQCIAAGGQVVTESFRPGDLCFINWDGGSRMGHVEIVFSVSGDTVSTIGGNSGSADSLYDRYVKKHDPLPAENIVAIVRPDYTDSCIHDLYIDCGVCASCGKVFDWEATFETGFAGIYTALETFTPQTGSPYDQDVPSDTVIEAGQTVEVAGRYRNAYGEYWYPIRVSDGQTVYAHENFLRFQSYLELQVTCTDFSPADHAILEPKSQPVKGTVTANYPLKSIHAYLNGIQFASWIADDEDTAQVSLQPTDINHDLTFGSLEAGSYTIELVAESFVHEAPLPFHESSFHMNSAEPVFLGIGTSYRAGEDVTFSWADIQNASRYGLSIWALDPEGGWTLREQLDDAETGLIRTFEEGTYQIRLSSFDPSDAQTEHAPSFFTVSGCAHTYTAAYTDGNCMEHGKITYTCSLCGDTYQEDGELGDHIWSDATCTEPKTCCVCGLTEGDALGHSFTDGHCERCGAEDTVVALPSGTCGGDLRWSLSQDGILTISGTGMMEDYPADIEVPWYDRRDAVRSVVIGQDVTHIGDLAFYGCTALTEVGFQGDAPSIGIEAFGLVTATVQYPANNATWTADVMQDYGGTLTWVATGGIQTPQILSCYSTKQTSVKVTWTPVDGADGYQLWRSTTPDDPESWILAKTIADGSTDRYTNQGLTEGVTYYYQVRAYTQAQDGSKICSDFSDVAHMPAAVVFDGPYSNATFRIRLRWAQVMGSHGYQIWRQNGDGSFSIAKTIGDRGIELTEDRGGTTAYSNTDLNAGQTYTYKMRAFYITEDGRKIFGAYSDEITVAVMPDTPTITVTSTAAQRATVAWGQVDGAAGYQIWFCDTADGSFRIAKSVTGGDTDNATLYGLSSGCTYYIRLRAYTEVDGKRTFGSFSETISIQIR